MGGKNVGLLAVAILAYIVWEVEVARFGRMYAPFQALFLWYLVFFLAYTLDRQRRALLPMLILSVLGVFVWEGGVFLALKHAAALYQNAFRTLAARRLAVSGGNGAPLPAVYWVATADFRSSDPSPRYPRIIRKLTFPHPAPSMPASCR